MRSNTGFMNRISSCNYPGTRIGVKLILLPPDAYAMNIHLAMVTLWPVCLSSHACLQHWPWRRASRLTTACLR